MEVVIQISEPSTGARTAPSATARQAVQKLGLTLEPIHPGSTDPVLSTYYRVRAPDQQAAARVVEAVRSLPSVTAAYVKPPDAPP
jgi:hypothetical protein